MRFQLMAWTWSRSWSFSLISPLSKSGSASQRAGDAFGHVRALQSHLTQADVVDRLDALAPGVDLGLVDVARGRGVLEEQRERQALVDVLGGRGVRVDDLLVADL